MFTPLVQVPLAASPAAGAVVYEYSGSYQPGLTLPIPSQVLVQTDPGAPVDMQLTVDGAPCVAGGGGWICDLPALSATDSVAVSVVVTSLGTFDNTHHLAAGLRAS